MKIGSEIWNKTTIVKGEACVYVDCLNAFCCGVYVCAYFVCKSYFRFSQMDLPSSINSKNTILDECWHHQIMGRLLEQVTLVHRFNEASTWDHVWLMKSWWRIAVIHWCSSLRYIESRIYMRIRKLEDWT